MSLYINALQSISAQNTFDTDDFFSQIAEPVDGRLLCQLPDYKKYIDARLMRRMSGVIRNGVASALACLRDAEIENPDAIVVGTGLGCLTDTIKFVRQLNENKEQMMNPTAFIQSTHNTISGQIALILKCHSHNLTFSQKSFSFESALLESLMLAAENSSSNILFGGVDELTPEGAELYCKTDYYKWLPKVLGEGSTFFSASGCKTEKSIAKIIDMEVVNEKLSSDDFAKRISEFICKNGIAIENIDLIVSGCCKGENDYYTALYDTLFKADVAEYKHLSGEYDTVSAFALWLGTKIMQNGLIPDATSKIKRCANAYSKTLIVNSQFAKNHSFILIEKC